LILDGKYKNNLNLNTSSNDLNSSIDHSCKIQNKIHKNSSFSKSSQNQTQSIPKLNIIKVLEEEEEKE
jgi:hypothetical protein